nr:synaptobrevin, WD40/YVTN repeat-like-containing domain protein [Tanacetum cinerariifolium]
MVPDPIHLQSETAPFSLYEPLAVRTFMFLMEFVRAFHDNISGINIIFKICFKDEDTVEGNTSVFEPVQQKESPKSTKDVAAKKEPYTKVDQLKIEQLSQPEHRNSGHNAIDSLVLLCCKAALCLYPLKSVIQRSNRSSPKEDEPYKLQRSDRSSVQDIPARGYPVHLNCQAEHVS